MVRIRPKDVPTFRRWNGIEPGTNAPTTRLCFPQKLM